MPTAKPKSLVAKLSEITGQLAHVKKEGFNKPQNYRFARESDVAAEASKLLAEHNIFILQSVGHHDMRELYQTQRGGTMYLSEVIMEFTFYDGDSDATLGPVRFPGHGADTGDKGIYKALTGAEKYFLMKTFLISTEDDPEADEKVDKEAAASTAARGGKRVQKGKQKGVERGGKSTGVTEAQVNEVAALTRDNELDAESLVLFIKEHLDKEPDSPEMSIRDWLYTLEPKEVAGIIAALTLRLEQAGDDSVEKSGTDGPSDGDEGEQEALDIV